MSENVLVLIALDESGVPLKGDLEAITLGSDLSLSVGGSLSIGVYGADTTAAAESIKTMGASKIFTISGEAYSVSRYKTDAAAAEAIARESGASIILGSASVRWSRIAAGLAQRLGGVFDSNITAIQSGDGAVSIDRWYYRQRMKGELSRTQRPWVLTASAGICAQAEPGETDAEVVSVDLAASASRTTVKGIKASAGDSQTIRPEADVLFVAGAGWTKKQSDGTIKVHDAESLILDFLDKADASLGSSKSLVDLGSEGQEVLSFLTHLHQIGQTGATPRHPKGLSTCCHGEEPHAVGWRFINERRAISMDANCGWAHGKADVLYVADAFEVMKHVNAML
ncbi:MAG: electron transfer flavoprotein subunit alpha/FixB family protein [Puniceicoccaceae bacterium]